MKTQLPSLITSDAQAGMALACELAERMQTHHEQAARLVERPGGMNYLIAPKMSVEAVSCVLFYAIAAANNGWAQGERELGTHLPDFHGLTNTGGSSPG